MGQSLRCKYAQRTQEHGGGAEHEETHAGRHLMGEP